jgi:hypothetical protein
MTPEKIEKLRALAERGVGGERDNARAILKRHGIDWKSKPSFGDKVKDFITNANKRHLRHFDFRYSTDLLFISMLLRVCKSSSKATMYHNEYTDILILVNVTYKEYSFLVSKYTDENRRKFCVETNRYAEKNIDLFI